MLEVAVVEAKEACGVDHIFVGMGLVIETVIYSMNLLWKYHAQKEYWGLLPFISKTNSMRRTARPCYGMYSMNVPVVHSLLLTATATGP